jgi:hypothetical protein
LFQLNLDLFAVFFLVFIAGLLPLENFCANFRKTVAAGARSWRPLLIEWKTTAGGFENRTKTFVFRRGVPSVNAFVVRVESGEGDNWDWKLS